MRTKISLMLPLICAPLAFWGCGDDSGSNSPKTEESSKPFAQVDSEDDLPNCIDKREDSLVVIRDSLSGFRCHDKKWVRYDVVSENEGDLPNCSKSRDGFVAYVVDDENELYCEDGKWVEENESSSSVAKSSSSVAKESSSSVKSSSSSAKSSSVASSSSVESSSSVASSSSAKSSSSSVIPSGAEGSSSSVASSSSEVVQLIPYTTECPSGKTCTYAPTEYLNPEITYGEFLDTRDYQVYKTVSIGTQTWMAQNLNYAYTGVPYSYTSESITSESTTYKSDSTSWCYNNVADSCAKYGRLYTWAAAIDSVALANDADNPQTCGYDKECDIFTAEALAGNPIQGVCPSGWHLPSYAEWDALRTAVGGSSTAGTALKSTSGWYDDGNGTDAYGFSALPAGYRNYNGYFYAASNSAYFWSASQYENFSYYAYRMFLVYDIEPAFLGVSYKYDGRSVRCIKD